MVIKILILYKFVTFIISLRFAVENLSSKFILLLSLISQLRRIPNMLAFVFIEISICVFDFEGGLGDWAFLDLD